MRTIAEFTKSGINNIAALCEALQLAMQLEFSTIPPYLCAQWSIDSSNDPSDVGGKIENIVVQEMRHFALAGNVLSAIGGSPEIANAGFVPAYPTNVLPGEIPQKLAVDLKPLSKTPDQTSQLDVFKQIEYPEFEPVRAAVTPSTSIGVFYTRISDAFATIPGIRFDPNAHFVDIVWKGSQIKDATSAQAAIAKIKAEGEGTQGSPINRPRTERNSLTIIHSPRS